MADVVNAAGQACRIIELNRPDKLNCLTLEMLGAVLSALEEAEAQRIIFLGAGRAFCTGLDLKEVAVLSQGRQHLERLVAIYRQMLTTRSSTLALACGHATGGGLGLVACAKTVVAADDLRLRLPGGELARLASVVLPVCNLRAGGRTPGGQGWLGCELDASQARQLGLVDRVVNAGEFREWVTAARQGTIAPEIFQPATRNEAAVAAALRELEAFVGRLPAFGAG